MSSTDTELFERFYGQSKRLFVDKEINEENLLQVVGSVMELVETYPDVTGSQKKELVIKIIFKILEDSDLPDDRKNILKTVLNITLAPTIDMIVTASRSELLINAKKKVSKKCCQVL